MKTQHEAHLFHAEVIQNYLLQMKRTRTKKKTRRRRKKKMKRDWKKLHPWEIIA